MHVVNKSQVSLVKGKPEMVSEASDLGFKPGEWPELISVIDNRNTGFLFLKNEAILEGHGEEFCGYRYRTRNGRFTLTVFND